MIYFYKIIDFTSYCHPCTVKTLGMQTKDWGCKISHWGCNCNLKRTQSVAPGSDMFVPTRDQEPNSTTAKCLTNHRPSPSPRRFIGVCRLTADDGLRHGVGV